MNLAKFSTSLPKMSLYRITFVAFGALLCTLASQGSTMLKPKAAVTAAPSVDVYYHTPEGVTFAGMDRNGDFNGDYAYAPVGKWLSTQAELMPESTPFVWTYPVSKNEHGVEKTATSTMANFQFRIKEAGLYSAPLLKADMGTVDASYTLAADGIKYGEYGTWKNFAVNYSPGLTTTVGNANELLSTNDPNATAYLNMAMAGSLFTDITVHGFGESFYDCGDFYLEAINAMVYSEQPLTTADIAVKVFHRERTSVDYKTEIAKLATDEVAALGDNRYYVSFRPAEPVFVTSAMQVVVLPAEGKATRFSPMMPLQKHYRASNMGTASLYATFSFTGKKAPLQCMDFFGTEVTNDDDTSAGFLNHWAIGVKGSYEKPQAGIGVVTVEADADPDAPVYNVSGVKVGTAADIDRLPAGIYISGGKKIMKR